MKRSRELDSLRGLAAVSVLLYHVLATNFPQLNAGVYLGEVTGRINNLLVHTPLHVIWLGAESVWLFFVLSGFVLTQSVSRPGFSWDAYYPSRIVRLYLPVVVAIGVAWLTYKVVVHVPTPADGTTLDGLPVSYPFTMILRDITLVGGSGNSLGVLWSLQWEVMFSLALPLYIFLARKRALASGIIAVVACMVGTYYNDPILTYLPMFMFGALMAHSWNRIERVFGFLTRANVLSVLSGAALFVLSICALCSFFLIGPWLVMLGYTPRLYTTPIVLLGICMLLVVVQTWTPPKTLLGMRPFVFSGKISYSLYLVHLPIVVAVVFALHIGKKSAVVAVLISAVAACVFYWFVERPSHRLSQKIGAKIRTEAAVETPAKAVEIPVS